MLQPHQQLRLSALKKIAGSMDKMGVEKLRKSKQPKQSDAPVADASSAPKLKEGMDELLPPKAGDSEAPGTLHEKHDPSKHSEPDEDDMRLLAEHYAHLLK